jgi:hypothetical protein
MVDVMALGVNGRGGDAPSAGTATGISIDITPWASCCRCFGSSEHRTWAVVFAPVEDRTLGHPSDSRSQCK